MPVVGDGACLQAVLVRCGGYVLLTASNDFTAKLWSAHSGDFVSGDRIFDKISLFMLGVKAWRMHSLGA